nr:hypothetical protein [Tanacetum cinerariifolium]
AARAAASSLFLGGGGGELGISKFGMVGIVNSRKRWRSKVYGSNGDPSARSKSDAAIAGLADGPGAG